MRWKTDTLTSYLAPETASYIDKDSIPFPHLDPGVVHQTLAFSDKNEKLVWIILASCGSNMSNSNYAWSNAGTHTSLDATLHATETNLHQKEIKFFNTHMVSLSQHLYLFNFYLPGSHLTGPHLQWSDTLPHLPSLFFPSHCDFVSIRPRFASFHDMLLLSLNFISFLILIFLQLHDPWLSHNFYLTFRSHHFFCSDYEFSLIFLICSLKNPLMCSCSFTFIYCEAAMFVPCRGYSRLHGSFWNWTCLPCSISISLRGCSDAGVPLWGALVIPSTPGLDAAVKL